ncbi:MAG: hypothetical protein WAW33_02810 [Minisyncoccia bacterium]
MSRKIIVGSKVLLRDQSTRIEEDFILVDTSVTEENNRKLCSFLSPGNSFLGKEMQDVVPATIHGKGGAWEIVLIV